MFSSMCKVHHCINYLLPEVKISDNSLRKRDHINILNYLLGTTVFFYELILSFQIQVTVFLVVNCLMSFCPFVHACLLYANKYTYIHTYM